MFDKKKLHVGNILIPNRYFLAPLAGYTDYAFREICKENGAGLVYTEMISANALFYNSKETYSMIKETEKDTGLVALQLFGGNLEHNLKAIEICQENAKYDFLDFNLGCSVPKVLKQEACAYLIDKPEILEPMLRELVEKSDKPVIVKTRIGADNQHINILDNLKLFERVGVKMIALHGRSRKALYSGETYYNVIKEVKEKANIPIIANGNINLNNAKEIFDYTGADAIMIGREAIGNPTIFNKIDDLLNDKEVKLNSLKEQAFLLKRQFLMMLETKSEKDCLNLVKGFGPHYFRGFKNSKYIRTKLVTLKTVNDYLQFFDELLLDDEGGY